MDNKNCIQEHYGHRRQPALGKAMPVTALLLNLNLDDGTRRRQDVQEDRDEDDENPPRYFNVTDEPPSPDGGEEPPPPPAHYRQEPQLAGSSAEPKPCLNCLGLGDHQMTSSSTSAINEMCLRLCGDECRQPQGLSLGGQRLRQDFLKQYEIAEALAKTSAMTSTVQMRQRLAARKLEIDFEMDVELDATKQQHQQQQQQQGVASPSPNSNSNRRQTAAAVGGDTVPPSSSFAVDYEPPRDLLLYLVRMGSFNSAPKINNVDSQDDGLELPKGLLSTSALLQHVQQSRGMGIEQPSLLSRCFLKPLLMDEDVTDGLRCLQLNSVSRVCSAPIEGDSSQNIRLLQWNILSQTLGQHNDGFVRCPEEALDWQHRKYLIVQEILQNQPDVICLQEVDHFKFLQTVLGSQNYAGIFFPKPDSPCLYIEQNNGPDGCAIFYKRDKLQLMGYDTRVLEVWRVQSNQVAIAARLQLKASGREFCVCTTHLKARHGALLAKLRNEQGRDLMRFVKQFAGETPLLLCGDFNAEPIEPIYATILGCDLFKLGSAYADVKLEREQILQHSEDVNEFVSQSIKREPPYTTWKIREEGEECHTIDYVFYTPDHLKIKNCLEFPAGEEIGKNRTPSYRYPSDHFSLVCDFELLDGPPPTSGSGDQADKASDSEGEGSKHGNIQ
ncbi:nocturnin isoform X1 [Drosophila pseudoobscura]|uniref:Nocturnin n=1 Tax=Drosophila pseudoobscura pseudoobscura TaxID=46245 RepID=A0A6I8V677_DROPS|nr:nocturnin isoform X1 [Drosophila pseudoobscura]